jgi:hypothetical protein
VRLDISQALRLAVSLDVAASLTPVDPFEGRPPIWPSAPHPVTMGRTRRSGNTAGEALPLQLHIAGPQKGVGPFSRRRASWLAQAVDSCRARWVVLWVASKAPLARLVC